MPIKNIQANSPFQYTFILDTNTFLKMSEREKEGEEETETDKYIAIENVIVLKRERMSNFLYKMLTKC